MKVVTSQEMRAIDERAIKEFGIPSLVLMENAGLQTVLAMERHFGRLAGCSICVICGKGNNGGDGLVIARHLHNRGAKVTVALLANRREIRQDAGTNLEIALKMNIAVQEYAEPERFPQLKQMLSQTDIIVDAIFGTGLRNTPRSFYLDVIQIINETGKPVVSADIPTGLDASTGGILGRCIQADLTVTYGLPKIGLIFGKNRLCAGQIEVADISLPHLLLQDQAIRVNLISPEFIASMLAPRKLDTHKGSYGHILVVAGSIGKTGAAVMAANAALRIGAGLVTLACPESVHLAIENKTTEVMSVPLPETDKHTIAHSAIRQILELAGRTDVIAIGPGLTTHSETCRMVTDLIPNLQIPIVADADALNAMPLSSLRHSRLPLIITPHPGEMSRLLEVSTQDIQASRLEAVQRTAEACNTYVVLKGDRTLISDPKGNVYINQTGNPGMATAGTGDVLTGMIAGLLGQHLTPLNAACAGVYIHGLAGDMARDEVGEMSLMAMDLLDMIPDAINTLTAHKR